MDLISLSLFLCALDGLISEAGDAGNITTLLISPLWVPAAIWHLASSLWASIAIRPQESFRDVDVALACGSHCAAVSFLNDFYVIWTYTNTKTHRHDWTFQCDITVKKRVKNIENLYSAAEFVIWWNKSYQQYSLLGKWLFFFFFTFMSKLSIWDMPVGLNWEGVF